MLLIRKTSLKFMLPYKLTSFFLNSSIFKFQVLRKQFVRFSIYLFIFERIPLNWNQTQGISEIKECLKFSHPWQFILHNTRQISGHRNSLCQWFDGNFLLFTSSLYKLLNIYTCSRSVFSMFTFLDFNPDGKNNRVIIRIVDFILYHCYLLENMKYHWTDIKIQGVRRYT